MRTKSVTFLIMTFLFSLKAYSLVLDNRERDPLGEVGNFEVDKSSKRTSSLIRSGGGKMEVIKFIPGEVSGQGFYQMNFHYDLQILFRGREQGQQSLDLESQFFHKEFMDELRTQGHFQGKDFKIRYLGKVQAQTLEGKFYPNCDRLVIEDIQSEFQSPFTELLMQLVRMEMEYRGETDMGEGSIKNLKIYAVVTEGIPVLGAVKLDIEGSFNGIGVKVGLDYNSR